MEKLLLAMFMISAFAGLIIGVVGTDFMIVPVRSQRKQELLLLELGTGQFTAV
jgi:hypothetical protein